MVATPTRPGGTMRRIILALIAALVATLGIATPAHALGEVYGWHWGGTVHVYDGTPNGTRWKVSAAAQEWSANSGANLVMTSDPNAAQIRVYQDTACGLGCSDPEQITSTNGVVNPGNVCTVHLNSTYSKKAYAQEVSAHEVGHCLGLDHTPMGSPSIMVPFLNPDRGQYYKAPQPYDYANMQQLYGLAA